MNKIFYWLALVFDTKRWLADNRDLAEKIGIVVKN